VRLERILPSHRVKEQSLSDLTRVSADFLCNTNSPLINFHITLFCSCVTTDLSRIKNFSLTTECPKDHCQFQGVFLQPVCSYCHQAHYLDRTSLLERILSDRFHSPIEIRTTISISGVDYGIVIHQVFDSPIGLYLFIA
jgi:hypothetical protein